MYDDLEEEIKEFISLDRNNFNALANNVQNAFLEMAAKLRFQRMVLSDLVLPKYKSIIDTINQQIPIRHFNLVRKHFETALLNIESINKEKYYLKVYDDISDPFYKQRLDNYIYCLTLLKDHPVIPVPKLIMKGENFILISSIDGINLQQYYKQGGSHDFTNQMSEIIYHLKKTVDTVDKRFFLIDNEMDEDGEEIYTIDELKLRYPWLSDVTDSSIFCHNDLHDENIIVHNNKIVGIIDWELGGFYLNGYERCKYKYLNQYTRFDHLF